MVIVFTVSSVQFSDVSGFWISGIWIPTLTQKKTTFSICLVCFVILIDLRWLFKEVSSKWIVPCHYDHVCILFALVRYSKVLLLGAIHLSTYLLFLWICNEFSVKLGHIGWLQSLPLNRKDHFLAFGHGSIVPSFCSSFLEV